MASNRDRRRGYRCKSKKQWAKLGATRKRKHVNRDPWLRAYTSNRADKAARQRTCWWFDYAASRGWMTRKEYFSDCNKALEEYYKDKDYWWRGTAFESMFDRDGWRETMAAGTIVGSK